MKSTQDKNTIQLIHTGWLVGQCIGIGQRKSCTLSADYKFYLKEQHYVYTSAAAAVDGTDQV